MSNEEIRIAIAEACKTLGGWYCGICRRAWPPQTPLNQCPACRNQLHQDSPDYPNDLNAMHEAEEIILKRDLMNGLEGYHNTLCRIIDNGNAIHATARQRAEALLRVKGLWKSPAPETPSVEKNTVKI